MNVLQNEINTIITAMEKFGTTTADASAGMNTLSKMIESMGVRLNDLEEIVNDLRPASVEETETPKQKDRLEFFDPNMGYDEKEIYKDVVNLECSKDNIFIY